MERGPIDVVAGALGTAARGLFRGISQIRGRRSLHPDGVGFRATFTPHSSAYFTAGVELLNETEPREAFVRLSRGAGLPAPFPDVLGLAIRFPDAYGPGRHQDLLLATSGSAPVLRHLLLPGARGFLRSSYSSILPYRVPGDLVLFGASSSSPGPSPAGTRDLPDVAPGREFHLCVGRLPGSWEDIGVLRIGDRLPDDEAEGLRFNPWNSGGGLRPAGPLMGMRDPAYRGSQEGRPTAAEPVPARAVPDAPPVGHGRRRRTIRGRTRALPGRIVGH